MPSKKIVCLGGGGRYFQNALCDLALSEGLAGSEVTLYDIDKEKCRLMAGFGRRMTEQAGTRLNVRACDDLAEAVDGADFALSAVGGAGASADSVYSTPVHREDILIPARYGIHQIVGDTCGPAGMMMGLRSVPVYLHFCRELERRAPNAILLNHSNPMAVLCRAMVKHTNVRQVIGICHGVQAGVAQAAKALDAAPDELDVVWVGTNHYYWFTRVCRAGRDVYPELRRRLAEQPPDEHQVMCRKLSELYGFQITYPDDSHALEFYPYLTQTPDLHALPYHVPERFLDVYDSDEETAPTADADREAQLAAFGRSLEEKTLPAKRLDPGASEGIGTLIEAMASGRRHVHIVNIPNQGAVPNLPAHAVLEVEGVTDSCGVRPVYMDEAPPALAALLYKRIVWQELVADAAVTGDRRLALQALLTDEMAIRPERVEKMLDELLAANRDYLPQFQG